MPSIMNTFRLKMIWINLNMEKRNFKRLKCRVHILIYCFIKFFGLIYKTLNKVEKF